MSLFEDDSEDDEFFASMKAKKKELSEKPSFLDNSSDDDDEFFKSTVVDKNHQAEKEITSTNKEPQDKMHVEIEEEGDIKRKRNKESDGSKGSATGRAAAAADYALDVLQVAEGLVCACQLQLAHNCAVKHLLRPLCCRKWSAGIVDDHLHAAGGGSAGRGAQGPTHVLGAEAAQHKLHVRGCRCCSRRHDYYVAGDARRGLLGAAG